MEKKEIGKTIICASLIMLWVYTALSKLSDVEVFISQLNRQPEPISTVAPILIWVVPLIELLTATLLMFKRTQKSGLLLSFFLMLAFTGYVGMAVIGYWEDIPCSCGGVLNQLGWNDHLWFNLFFLGVAATGAALERHSTRSKHQGGNLQQAAPAGGPA